MTIATDAEIDTLERSISATRADLDHTLSALERQFSPESLMHQAMAYAKTTPGEFFANFGETVKSNPIPSAMLAVSVGWLMMSGRHQTVPTHELSDSPETHDFYDQGLSPNGSALERVAAGTEHIKDVIHSRASSFYDRAHHLRDEATHIGEEMRHMTDTLVPQVQENFQRAKDGVARTVRTIARQPRRIQHEAGQIADQHPFLLGLVAFAAGAAIAASLKRTQVEDRIMGEYRDQAVEEIDSQVNSTVEEGVELARTFIDGNDGKNGAEPEDWQTPRDRG